VYDSARPEQICMMVCPKPHCPEDSSVVDNKCAKRSDSCCGFKCVENMPVEEPCMMVDCAPGYDLMMTDARGCGGICVPQCNKVTDMKDCASMPECKVEKYENPKTFEVSDVCAESAKVCCMAMTAGCVSCADGYKSAAAWCEDHPHQLDCDEIKMPDTCQSCVTSGLKWSAGSCFKECAMDTSCWTSLKGCSIASASTSDGCKSQSSCETCTTLDGRHCNWNAEGGYCTDELSDEYTDNFAQCPRIKTVKIILLSGGSAGVLALIALSVTYVRRKNNLREHIRVNSLSSLGDPIEFDDKKDAASPEEEVVGQPIVSTSSVVVV